MLNKEDSKEFSSIRKPKKRRKGFNAMNVKILGKFR